jgi:integrase
MGSVYLHGRKLWIRFKGPNGWTQRRTEFIAGQEKQARAVLEQLEARLRAGATIIETGPLTVERYFATWIQDRKAEIATWQNDDFVFRLHVLPTLGAMRLDEVRASHLVALVKGWRQKMAGKSVWNAYSSLSAFFRDAALADHVSTSPCILTKRQLGSKEPKDPEFRASAVFTRAELEQLVSDDRIPLDRRVLYALGGLAGLRHGESAGLRFRNCATPAEPLAMIYVAFSYGRAYPKGGRCRPVPVHPALAAILSEWRLHGWSRMMGREPTADDLVLPIPADAEARPGQMRTRQYSGDHFERDLATLGFRHRRGHDLRRTFISLTRSDGARADILRRVTHKPPPEVFEGYTTFEWPVVCAEVAKLRVQRRRTADVIALATRLATSPRQVPAGTPQTTMALPGLEPGRGVSRSGF